MKRMVCVLGVLVAMATMASAANIAFWNFHDTTNLGGTSDPWRINPWGTVGAETEYASDFGTGTGELSAWGAADVSEGNLVGTNGGPIPTTGQFGSFTGTTLNDVSGSSDNSSFSPIGVGNNGKFFLIELDDAIQGCVLSYATRGTATGYTTHQIDYSTNNGVTWTPMATIPGRNVTTFSVQTVNFSDVFIGTSGHENNLIRITVSGATFDQRQQPLRQHPRGGNDRSRAGQPAAARPGCGRAASPALSEPRTAEERV